ncbi:imidazole glycerol phosphate synthase subunit HisH [Synechococcus lacustris]|uniref:imidazole glycerol phosphate synthase subunit HisH n=1 Tax=Synechococcus lacustris TaxID=2116544 RepID=UPI0020CD4FB1|nr:imidazole glycerol phosphate synthase subunit HisH [Synechococcus lacustris]MCP9812234.1 imidazole glycerol phosphate synthase subunit HisH [Synechococcus lacustris Maggiore-St4-Slac]
MKRQNVTIIDYGKGNLWSILSALQYLGCNPEISNDPGEIQIADSLILPGVGSFRKAMCALKKNNLDQAIVHAVKINGRKILGICLGMQLLGTNSTEDGFTSGLGLISNGVDKFSKQNIDIFKIPHVGFNLVHSHPGAHLFKGLPQAADFYFVHSYRMLPNGLSGTSATCNYGEIFLASYEQDNIFATQFHPEKSQTNGLLLLKNFLAQ